MGSSRNHPLYVHVGLREEPCGRLGGGGLKVRHLWQMKSGSDQSRTQKQRDKLIQVHWALVPLFYNLNDDSRISHGLRALPLFE